MIINLYRFAFYPLGFLLSHTFWFFIPRRLRDSLRLKWRSRAFVSDHTKSIMIHAASGEIEYAKSVIRELKKTHPTYKILITYSSPSFENVFAKDPELLTTPLPFDFLFLMKQFLKQNKIAYVLIARSDLWPNLVTAAETLKIPVLYFSVTQHKNADEMFFLKKYFLNELYSKIEISAVSFDDQKKILTICPTANCTVDGDTRFDQVIFRNKNLKPLPFSISPKSDGKKRFILASVWMEDLEVWAPLLKQILSDSFVDSIWIVPHETDSEYLKRVHDLLRNEGLSFDCVDLKSSEVNSNICVIGVTGYLSELYSYCDIAFVGGSFKSKVHSVMEALAWGLPVCVGPYYKNNREAIEFSNIAIEESNLKMVTPVTNADEIENWLHFVLPMPHAVSNLIKSQILKHSGATPKIIEKIKLDTL